MRVHGQYNAFLHNRAFFSVIPHKNEFTIFHYDILLCIDIHGGMCGKEVHQQLGSDWRAQRSMTLLKRVKYLYENNYLSKQGAKYHLTNKSMLLIAQVERKLKALVGQHVEANPVGRPYKSKD